MAKITRIIYPVFEVKDLQSWEKFADQLWGLPIQQVGSTGDHEIVIDDSGCRIILRQGKANDIVAAGWETDDLDGLFDSLNKAGADPQWQDPAAAKARGVERLFTVVDPSGLVLEVFDRSTSANEFFASRHGLEFETGELGFGHITLVTGEYDALEDFYCQQLGMGISDYIDFEIVKGFLLHLGFFHANPRHHSLAAGRMSGLPRRLHHFMLQVRDRHQVGISFDRIRAEKMKVANEIGVHPNDRSFSFYVKTPSGFESEQGAEDLSVDVDDAQREIATYDCLSIWGHKMSAKDEVPLKALATFKKWTGGGADR